MSSNSTIIGLVYANRYGGYVQVYNPNRANQNILPDLADLADLFGDLDRESGSQAIKNCTPAHYNFKR